MASSVELFLIMWLVSAQYSCDVEDIEEDYSAPLLNNSKGQEVSLNIKQKEF